MDHQPANPAEPIDAERLGAYVALIDKLMLGARENANSGRMNSWNFGILGRILIRPLLMNVVQFTALHHPGFLHHRSGIEGGELKPLENIQASI
jgi:hypothetical protein